MGNPLILDLGFQGISSFTIWSGIEKKFVMGGNIDELL
jgi:hypothetical protein